MWRLPVLVFSVAAALGAVALALPVMVGWGSDAGAPSQGAGTAVPGTVSPDLREPGDVCQGLPSRLEPGEPARFADLYTKRREVMGIHIVAVEAVADEALAVATATVAEMLTPELAGVLADEGAYVIVMSRDQHVLDLPEFRCLAGTPAEGLFDDVCGVADRADYPVATVSELDLLGDRRGPCRGLNVLYHEVAHLVHGWAVGPTDYVEIRVLYQKARESGVYEGEYALRSSREYFAEVSQAYFLSIDLAGRKDRDWLKANDPGAFELLRLIYGD